MDAAYWDHPVQYKSAARCHSPAEGAEAERPWFLKVSVFITTS
jgi:hypothetical protein